jgi:hypothetical protein
VGLAWTYTLLTQPDRDPARVEASALCGADAFCLSDVRPAIESRFKHCTSGHTPASFEFASTQRCICVRAWQSQRRALAIRRLNCKGVSRT